MKKVQKQQKKGSNSVVILGAWTIWRNACVFDGSAPSIQGALQVFKDESQWWLSAGAKGLAALDLGRIVV